MPGPAFLLAAACAAAPLEGRLVVSGTPLVGDRVAANVGLEAEVGPRDGWFAVGATGWRLGEPSAERGPWREAYAATTYLRGRLARGNGHELSAVLGQNYRYARAELCPGSCGPDTGSTTPVVGLAWHYATDRYWLRFTPQVALTSGWISEALPWAEAGVWLAPGLGAGIRFGPGIAQGVWRF